MSLLLCGPQLFFAHVRNEPHPLCQCNQSLATPTPHSTTTDIHPGKPDTLTLWPSSQLTFATSVGATMPADALSRMDTNSIIPLDQSNINFEVMAQLQTADPELQWMVSHPDATSLTLEQVPLPSNTLVLTLVCDTSTGKHRPMVPPSMCRQVLHSMSHPGMKATQRLITARLVWPNIKRDVRQWTKACLSCQRAKVNRHTTLHLRTPQC